MKNVKTTNNISITIGIPTYEAGESLITTLTAIYKQEGFNQFVQEVLLLVDGNLIAEHIVKKIQHPKLIIIQGKTRKGQSGRMNDILKKAKGELIILTNDDVILEKNAVKEITNNYKNSHADLITTNVKPLPARNQLQKILSVGNDIKDIIHQQWNHGDNFLSCNGRLICLSRRLAKKIVIPQKLWNNDSYVYLFAKNNNFITTHEYKAICYYLFPSTLKEHIKQSTKFNVSLPENQQYFKTSLTKFYTIPSFIVFSASINYFLKNPVGFIAYTIVNIVSKFSPSDRKNNTKGFWQTDVTTKNIGVNTI